jgi:hypothetical protein
MIALRVHATWLAFEIIANYIILEPLSLSQIILILVDLEMVLIFKRKIVSNRTKNCHYCQLGNKVKHSIKWNY